MFNFKYNYINVRKDDINSLSLPPNLRPLLANGTLNLLGMTPPPIIGGSLNRILPGSSCLTLTWAFPRFNSLSPYRLGRDVGLSHPTQADSQLWPFVGIRLLLF